MSKVKPILIHIPHSSTVIPDEVRATFLVDPAEIELELLRLTDRYTDDLFQLESADCLVFGVSRIVVDPERFADDSQEEMANRGMGAVYTKTSQGTPLRSGENREELLAQYYHPHHRRLSEWAEKALSEHGRCLIIDCHSFPSKPLPCDQDQTQDRPMFCVGTDTFHTPSTLTKIVVAGLEKLVKDLPCLQFKRDVDGVLVNRPYSGTMVPGNCYNLDSRASSVMIELNRSIYMDEDTGEILDGFAEIQDSLIQLLEEIAVKW